MVDVLIIASSCICTIGNIVVFQNISFILLFDENVKLFKTEENEKILYVFVAVVFTILTVTLNMKQVSYVSRITMVFTLSVLVYVLFDTLISFYFYELEQEKIHIIIK